MTVSKATGPMWNDVDGQRDENQAREIDEQVEMRCKSKRLSDCELPEGFRLVTPAPRQYWLNQQLQWAFELRFRDHPYPHIARYHQQVSDEMQMHWAIADFTAYLLFNGVSLTPNKKQYPIRPPRVAVNTIVYLA